jgi:hypothetical protein
MRSILLLLGIAALMFVTIVQIVSAQGADIWFPDSSGGNDYARLVDPTWGLLVDDLASAGTPCVTVDSVGRFGTSTCGSGSGSFATSSADYWISQYYKGYFFSTTSADHWETTQTARTADDLSNNSIEDLSDVAAMTENYGDLLGWNGSTWTDFATSALKISWNDLANIPAGFADGTDDTAGGGSGAIATSSAETAGQLAYWTTTNGTPARLSTVATGTLTCSSGISCTSRAVIGGSSAITLDATGNWTGTLDGFEAAALIAAGFSTTSANYWETQQTARTADDLTNNSITDLSDVDTAGVSAGNILGFDGSNWVDMSTSSYLISSELDTIAELETQLGSVNVLLETEIDAASELAALLDDETGSAGGGVPVFSINPLLSGFRSYASSTIGDGTLAGGLTVSGGATTTATSTLKAANIQSALTLFGSTVSTHNALCILLTGTADLCDGSDDGGVGGGSLHADAGSYIYPKDGDYHSAPRYSSTSTTATSTSLGPWAFTASADYGSNNFDDGFVVMSSLYDGTILNIQGSSSGSASDDGLVLIEQNDASHANELLALINNSTSAASEEWAMYSPVPDWLMCDTNADANDCFEGEQNDDWFLLNGRNSGNDSFERAFIFGPSRTGGMLGLGTNFSTASMNAKLTIVATTTVPGDSDILHLNSTTNGQGDYGRVTGEGVLVMGDYDAPNNNLGRILVARGALAPSSIDLDDTLAVGATNANATNKYLGQFGWFSADSNFSAAKLVAYIGAEASETYAADDDVGSHINFYTGTQGNSNPTLKAQLQDDGDFQLVSGNLDIDGTGTSTLAGNADLAGDLNADQLFVTGATSTFASGLNITGGCFAQNGTCLTTSAGTIDGSGSGGRVTYWSDADTLTSDTDLTFDGSRLTATNLLVSSYATTTYLVTKGAATPAITDTATYFWTDTNGFANFRTSLDDTGFFYYNGSGSELFAVDSSISAWRSLYSLDVNGTATSTFNRGINIDGTGCFAVNGVCVGGVGGTGTVNSGTQGQFAYYAGAGTAVSGTSTIFIDTDKQIGIGTTSPQETFNVVGNYIVEGQTGSKAYRFRTTGSNLDFDAGGADLYFTNNTAADFTGTERKYLVMGSTFDFVAAFGGWEWQDRAGGAVQHKIDGEGGVVFNEQGGDRDFRVESDTITHLLFTDASTNRVGVGSSTPWAFLGILPDASATRPIFSVASSTNTSILEVTATGSVKINDKGVLYDFTTASASSSKNSNDKFDQIAWCPNGYKAISGGYSFGTTTAGIDLGALATEPTATSGGWSVDAIETVSVTTNWDVKVTANCTRLSY